MKNMEAEIATYLANTPDFFDRHAELLADIQLISPHGKRAVSLQERQIELQRDKTHALELKMAEIVRYAQENDAIQNKLQAWACGLLAHTDDSTLPETLSQGLTEIFNVPQAALKLWRVQPAHETAHWASGAGDDIKSFAASMTQPYCGANSGFEAVQWLAAPDAAKSLALVALKSAASSSLPPCYGLLVLASDDAERFRQGMGTAFLQRIGELSGAALSRLISRDN